MRGGVIRNALLRELACRGLAAEDVHVSLCAQVPGNDGGLCYGRIIEYAARIGSRDDSC
ncbi:MAG: Kae1-like domain-containing protein [Steroidobacteraceae bacterium]